MEKTIACVTAAAPFHRPVTAGSDLISELSFTSLPLLDLSFEIERTFRISLDISALLKPSGGASLRVAEIAEAISAAIERA